MDNISDFNFRFEFQKLKYLQFWKIETQKNWKIGKLKGVTNIEQLKNWKIEKSKIENLGVPKIEKLKVQKIEKLKNRKLTEGRPFASMAPQWVARPP